MDNWKEDDQKAGNLRLVHPLFTMKESTLPNRRMQVYLEIYEQTAVPAGRWRKFMNQNHVRKEKSPQRGQRNYQKELDKKIKNLEQEGKVPKLLLHSCCAPCSSYVMEYLSRYFEITVFFYNPNIYPPREYEMRVKEEARLIQEMPFLHPVRMVEGAYEPERFYEAVKGLEKEPEGGARCEKCYELRLYEAARAAKAGGYDYFTTTLTISPLKPAPKLNEIGERIGEELGVDYLSSDFKKKDGYKRSVQLSQEYGLYRQNYCGCVYSQSKTEAL